MKTKIVKIIAFTVAVTSVSANAMITDVSIVPSLPTPLDVISIDISGLEGYGPVTITDSVFSLDGYLLQLDIYLDLGFLTEVTPWSHTENIGTFSAGVYELTVNTIVELKPVHNDTFFTTYEVVPEPMTFLLLGLGGLLLRNGENLCGILTIKMV